ncbi:MAG: acyltransferase [Oscillospiraceae bacterium]|nr:acyltransferase [Oscillospiraceae bacterium]
MNTDIDKFDSKVITVIRTVAMFCIVLCHLIIWFPEISFSAQIFNVGVPLFFIISGYLYGHKTIKNTWAWYGKQILKIVIPVYIYVILATVALICFGRNAQGWKLTDCLIFFFNLQGFLDGKTGNVVTMHLWFISFILLCYIITPLLDLSKRKIKVQTAKRIVIVLIIFEAVFVMSIKPFGFITQTVGVVSYIIAYYIGFFRDKRISRKFMIMLTVVTIVSLCVRLAVKYLDDSGNNILYSNIYERIIAPYTHCILAYFIFFAIRFICMKYERILEAVYPVCKIFDKYSYEVYIVHHMFITGEISVEHIFENMFFNVLLFAFLTAISAYILHSVSEMFKKRPAPKKIKK